MSRHLQATECGQARLLRTAMLWLSEDVKCQAPRWQNWLITEWSGVWGRVSPPQTTRGREGTSWDPPGPIIWGLGRVWPSQFPDYGVWGSVVNSPSGNPTETHFGIFWRRQNAPFCSYMILNENKKQAKLLRTWRQLTVNSCIEF